MMHCSSPLSFDSAIAARGARAALCGKIGGRVVVLIHPFKHHKVVNSLARIVKYGVRPAQLRGTVRGCLLELRHRSGPRNPSTKRAPAQHVSPHEVSSRMVRRRPHNPRRQRLEPLVVPPLRLGHLGARLLCQHAESRCRGTCPALRAHRVALLGLEKPHRGLHLVPRVVER
eukprot:scaffold34854_cov68-Phaeocystis_antarctica.AAC.5